MLSASFEKLVDGLDVRVEAFAVCEIGRHHSLVCAPLEHFLLHFVLAGEGYLDCPKGRFDLRQGMLTLVPPMTGKSLNGAGPIRHVVPAQLSCNPTDGIDHFRAFDGTPDLLLGCAALEASALREWPFLARLDAPFLVHVNEASLQHLFEIMRVEVQELREGSRAFLSAIMKQLLIFLLRSGRSDHRQLPSSPMADPRLQRAVNAVMVAPEAQHSVATMATAAAMSRASFSNHFLSFYGCTPMAFVQSARLQRAATLLTTSMMPIKSIAASVGYSSRSQFSKAFRIRYGQDPSAYRIGSGEAQA